MKTIKNPFKVLATKCLAIPIFAILFVPQFSYADDTAAVQALITAGSAFPAGKTYSVGSTLMVTKSVNFNGDVINFTATAASSCLKLTAAGVTVQNGTINGTWTPTSAYSTVGQSGISVGADNCTITKMTVQNVGVYGIVSGAHNNLTITYNKILNTGYIGFYFDSEAATTGGVFSYNTVDRSLIAPTAVHQLAVGIRGASAGTSPVASGWTIANNTITMPLNPTDWTAECIEVRAVANCVISGNTFNQSSIGVSVARSSNVTVTNNKITNAQLEAIEVNDVITGICSNNVITGGVGNGYLFDGAVGSNGVTITGDQISGTKNDCIHTTAGTQNVKIVNAVLSASNGTKPISLLGTTGVTVTGTTFKGDNSAGQIAVLLTNCAGGLTINGATISNFAKCLVYISNTTSGLVTNNISVSGNTVNGVATPLGTYLINGAAVGSNVVVTLK